MVQYYVYNVCIYIYIPAGIYIYIHMQQTVSGEVIVRREGLGLFWTGAVLWTSAVSRPSSRPNALVAWWPCITSQEWFRANKRPICPWKLSQASIVIYRHHDPWHSLTFSSQLSVRSRPPISVSLCFPRNIQEFSSSPYPPIVPPQVLPFFPIPSRSPWRWTWPASRPWRVTTSVPMPSIRSGRDLRMRCKRRGIAMRRCLAELFRMGKDGLNGDVMVI